MATKIRKHVSLIVSTGRTGTRFLGENLGDVIDDCASFHEPDMLTFPRRGKLQTIARFGLYQTVFGKLLDRTGIRAIGLQYLAGKVGFDATARRLTQHRAKFYASRPEELIVEAYNQWFSVLPVLPSVFANYRVAAIIRDPRSWLASASKWGLWWASSDLVAKLGLLRLSPDLVGDHSVATHWAGMDNFDRLAWSWATINHELATQADRDDRIRMFRFEDLFGEYRKTEEIDSLLAFVTHFEDRRFDYSLETLLRSRQIHASGGDSGSEWHDWTPSRCRRVMHFCGPLMERWGYGRETAWKRKLE